MDKKILVIDNGFNSVKENLEMMVEVKRTFENFEYSIEQTGYDANVVANLLNKNEYFYVFINDTHIPLLKDAKINNTKIYSYSSSSDEHSNSDNEDFYYLGRADTVNQLFDLIKKADELEVNIDRNQELLEEEEKIKSRKEQFQKLQEQEEAKVKAEILEKELARQAEEEEQERKRLEEEKKQKELEERAKNTETYISKATVLKENRIKTQASMIQEDIEKENQKEKTKVVTVFSAKGGVGKTTLAVNISTYLSLLPYKRGQYKVCIVDFDLALGDVRNFLGYDDKDPDIITWVRDIKHKHTEGGMNYDDITYSKNEIDQFLCKNKHYDLYALLAPLLLEYSLEIEEEELDVIIRNLINNGGFDFIVFDVGNNADTPTIKALDASDHILLVTTQDVTTSANNGSALRAFSKIDLDLSKVRLVINNVISYKQAGVSVAEIEEAFSEYPCIARVRNSGDIIKSNNYSRPIVLKPNHEVTKSLKNIVLFLTDKEEESKYEPKKKRKFDLLGFLRDN